MDEERLADVPALRTRALDLTRSPACTERVGTRRLDGLTLRFYARTARHRAARGHTRQAFAVDAEGFGVSNLPHGFFNELPADVVT